MAGIYIHFPFCRQACHYCNFHFSTQLRYQGEILQAFEKEIQLRISEIPQHLESIYFGGGSPSIIAPKSLYKIIKTVKENFKFNDNIEITIEVNPDDVSLEYLEELLSVGINRLSIGVQSFFDSELEMMNRVHNASQAVQTIEWTAKLFDNFSIDLIYGVPSSNLLTWQKNLNQALSFNIPHLSTYALTVESKTILAHQLKNNEIQLLDDEWVKLQYDWMIIRLEEAGYENYEFSNFSKPGFNSVNNSNYWRGKPYLGIGPSAHSFDGKRKRSWNLCNNVKYLKSIQKGNLPSSFEELTTNELFNEYLMTALRTSMGVSLQKINEKFGEYYIRYLEKQVENHLMSQRLFWDGDTLKVSKTAKFLTDGIASDLFIIKS